MEAVGVGSAAVDAIKVVRPRFDCMPLVQNRYLVPRVGGSIAVFAELVAFVTVPVAAAVYLVVDVVARVPTAYLPST